MHKQILQFDVSGYIGKTEDLKKLNKIFSFKKSIAESLLGEKEAISHFGNANVQKIKLSVTIELKHE